MVRLKNTEAKLKAQIFHTHTPTPPHTHTHEMYTHRYANTHTYALAHCLMLSYTNITLTCVDQYQNSHNLKRERMPTAAVFHLQISLV